MIQGNSFVRVAGKAMCECVFVCVCVCGRGGGGRGKAKRWGTHKIKIRCGMTKMYWPASDTKKDALDHRQYWLKMVCLKKKKIFVFFFHARFPFFPPVWLPGFLFAHQPPTPAPAVSLLFFSLPLSLAFSSSHCGKLGMTARGGSLASPLPVADAAMNWRTVGKARRERRGEGIGG